MAFTGTNLSEFISDLHRYADAEVLTPQLAADTLRKYLRAGLIVPEEVCSGDDDAYSQHVLHAAPSHSVVALTWLPGQRTSVHDHISWCVSGVVEGIEVDESFRLWKMPGSGRKVLVPVGRTTGSAGRISVLLPPDEDIHRVSNMGTGKAVSLHVYGADISANGNSSINRVFGNEIVAAAPSGGRLVSWRHGDDS